MIQLYHQIIHKNLRWTYHKITFIEKIKTIATKIEQKKVQYDLDRHTAKFSASLSGNVGRYEFSTGKDVLPEKGLLKKLPQSKNFNITIK